MMNRAAKIKLLKDLQRGIITPAYLVEKEVKILIRRIEEGGNKYFISGKPVTQQEYDMELRKQTGKEIKIWVVRV